MDVDLSGTTTFISDTKGEQRFRYTVKVVEDKLTIWLEDRSTKQQWRTMELEQSEYVDADTAIPRAKPSDYASRFVECLLANQDQHAVANTAEDTKVANHDAVAAAVPYKRSLSDVAKDGSRSLTLTLSLGVAASFHVDLEYGFYMMPVALEQVDILAAQVRDLREEVAALKDAQTQRDLEISTLKLKQTTIATVLATPVVRNAMELRTLDTAKANQVLRWTSPSLFLGKPPFVLTDNAQCIEVAKGGYFLVTLCINHSSSNTTTQVEVMLNGKSHRVFTDGSPYGGGGSGASPNGKIVSPFAGGGFGAAAATPTTTSATNHVRDSTFVLTMYIPPQGKLSVNYRGNVTANIGSSMSLVEL